MLYSNLGVLYLMIVFVAYCTIHVQFAILLDLACIGVSSSRERLSIMDIIA